MSLAQSLPLLVVLALAQPSHAANGHTAEAEAAASRLLSYIRNQDSAAIAAFAANPDVFDAHAMRYLIGDSDFRVERRPDVRSAYAILARQDVMKSVKITSSADSVTTVDVVYFPRRTAARFEALQANARAGEARLFRDYVACRFTIAGGVTRMTNACNAETDHFDED